MAEIISLRQENTKTFDLGGNKRGLECHIGAIHYRDNYADLAEEWKDIDLTWVGNTITKAPYELTLEANKVTIRDKKTGEVSIIELLEIGGIPIPAQAWEKSKGLAKAFATDLEIVVENSAVRFARILSSDRAPTKAKYKVTTKMPIKVSARDVDGELPVEWALVNEVLDEDLKPDRVVKYPVRIDPTWQVGASTDDCYRRKTDNTFSLVSTWFIAGAADAASYMYGCGGRFTNITIPKNATIGDGTHLTLRCDTARAGEVVNSRISAEDVDDAPTFADEVDGVLFDARWANRTTARVDWDAIPAWTAGEDYNSPEIKTVIKEIVDRAGWVSGNDIVIFWDDFDDRSTHANVRRSGSSYDGSTDYAPKLVITYGWAHIAKVLGVAAAAIAKVNGVAVAAIAKVNGVAV